MPIQKVLIANRGEISCRIARSCQSQGIDVVGVHSEADRNSRHVRIAGHSCHIGAAAAEHSYLNIDAIIKAAKDTGADAVHPGFGFLAESPEFSRRLHEEGIIFIGPTAATLEQLGDKGQAKALAQSLKIPVIPGAETSFTDADEISEEAKNIGVPVLLKAVAGGGGRGQRIVRDLSDIAEEAEAAMREAKAGFGDSAIIVEKLIEGPRHIEIQIAGDGYGEVIHLFERDSFRGLRRYAQLEEAPAQNLPRAFLEKIAGDGVKLAKALDYRGVCTMEFLVAGDEYWFLEANPRIQVEHPVTEEVTGVDIVDLQLRIAAGDGLGLKQSDIKLNGHAVEARIYAEDPSQNFAPSTGRIDHVVLPSGVRIEAGVDDGDQISPHYDPMIAKVIVHKPNRVLAIDGLNQALARASISGVACNIDFLRSLLDHESVRSGNPSTEFIDDTLEDLVRPKRVFIGQIAAAAAIWILNGRSDDSDDLWQRRGSFTGWRLGTGEHKPAPVSILRLGHGEEIIPVRISGQGAHGEFSVATEDQDTEISLTASTGDDWLVTHRGQEFRITAHVGERDIMLMSPQSTFGSVIFSVTSEMDAVGGAGAALGDLLSPLMGQIVKLVAKEGDELSVGDTVAVLESMKMEIPIKASKDGTLIKLACSEGDMVERGKLIAEIE